MHYSSLYVGLLIAASVASTTSAQEDALTLTINAKEAFNLYIDGLFVFLENSRNVTLADSWSLSTSERLVAFQGINIADGCPGVVASVTDDYLVTNSSWKCSDISGGPDWAALGFDDSSWLQGIELKRNVEDSTECGSLPYMPSISPNAYWIWVESTSIEVVYCRGYLPVCSSSPCRNGATCNSNEVALCSCPGGYSGIYCETEIDECASDPCLNGGTCQEFINGYVCSCFSGNTGPNCETDVDDCASQPCFNNGTCEDSGNGWLCVCEPGFTGDHCETGSSSLALLVTGDRELVLLYIDGVSQPLDPEESTDWTTPVRVPIYSTSRLIAVRCLNSYTDDCSGIMASVGDDFVTDAARWKCSADSPPNWFDPEFDDSSWPNAVEYDRNTPPMTHCLYRNQVPDVSANAYWIWTSDHNIATNCRGYVYDPCASDPCLNGGTCNSVLTDYSCTCGEQFSGPNCEEDLFVELALTADRAVVALYVEGYFRTLNLTTSSNWTQTERVLIPKTTSLIGIRATDAVAANCSGILASIGESFTTGVHWRCSNDNSPGWYSVGFDDSAWPAAVDYGRNDDPFFDCAYRHQLPDIGSSATWIYIDDQTVTANCRGYLPIVDIRRSLDSVAGNAGN